jgi:hypothetical protein
MTAERGEHAVAEVVDPSLGPFRITIERAAANILSEPDDAEQTHVFEQSSFFSALENARRGIVQSYQQLENRRIDEKVEAELGLRFYLEGFTVEKRTFESCAAAPPRP